MVYTLNFIWQRGRDESRLGRDTYFLIGTL